MITRMSSTKYDCTIATESLLDGYVGSQLVWRPIKVVNCSVNWIGTQRGKRAEQTRTQLKCITRWLSNNTNNSISANWAAWRNGFPNLPGTLIGVWLSTIFELQPTHWLIAVLSWLPPLRENHAQIGSLHSHTRPSCHLLRLLLLCLCCTLAKTQI